MISLIIPTYRERDNVEPLLRRVSRMAPELGEPLEVLVVDNRSDDGTAEQARQLLGQLVPGRLIECPQPVELAQAVTQAAREARGDVIGVMDADLSHPPELLPELARAARAGAEVAVASRYVPGGRIERWPWHRRWLSRIGNLLAQPLTGVADATSGYFVCRAGVLKSLTRPPRGFKILLELLVRGKVQRVQEIPYTFTDRLHGSSKLGCRVLWRYGTQVAWLYAYRLRNAHG